MNWRPRPCGSSSRGQTLVEALEWCHTPKHGSWLNLAESEIGALSCQCLDRLILDKQTLTDEITASGCRCSQQGAPFVFLSRLFRAVRNRPAIATCTRLRAGSVYGVVLCPVALFCRHKGVNGEDIAVPLAVSVKATQVWIGLRRKKRAARQSVGIIVGIVNYRLKKYVIKTCR